MSAWERVRIRMYYSQPHGCWVVVATLGDFEKPEWEMADFVDIFDAKDVGLVFEGLKRAFERQAQAGGENGG